ncbi:hypothetical protein EI94DRAFT_935574 [Lactarius quietus]|nr:hypothetical protein EI94DRAFT_935574 [Lactarius quietus]
MYRSISVIRRGLGLDPRHHQMKDYISGTMSFIARPDAAGWITTHWTHSTVHWHLTSTYVICLRLSFGTTPSYHTPSAISRGTHPVRAGRFFKNKHHSVPKFPSCSKDTNFCLWFILTHDLLLHQSPCLFRSTVPLSHRSSRLGVSGVLGGSLTHARLQ